MGFADEALAERALALLGGDQLGTVERERRTVRVSSNRGAHVLVDVLRRFDGDGIEPDTLSVREPSLDDVFLALTGHRARRSTPREAPHERSTAVETSMDVALDRRIPMGVVRDTAAIVQRNLIAYRRVPQLLVFSTIQPVIFVVMFRYVFGGAVSAALPAGVDYVDYLMPGIFVQTVVFGAIATAIGLATDMKSGLMERFHALPMARSAVLERAHARRHGAQRVRGRADDARRLPGRMAHPHRRARVAGRRYGIVVLFGFSMSWVFATVGLAVGDPETAQAASFPVLAPLVFASSAFVPIETMPPWLQTFAEHQPVSAAASAVRALTLGGPAADDVIASIAWSVGLIAIFGTISVRLYRRAV